MGLASSGGTGNFALLEEIRSLKEEVFELNRQLNNAKQEISSLNSNIGNINPIKDSVTNGDVIATIREKIEYGQKTGTILFVDSSGLPGNLQHAVIQYMNPKGTSNIYLEASFVNSPRYYGWIAPNSNIPVWKAYVTSDDSLSNVRIEKIPSIKVENFNFATISNYAPTEIADSFEFATVINFGSASESFSVLGRGRTFYISAKNGTIITNLELMFWFYEKNRK